MEVSSVVDFCHVGAAVNIGRQDHKDLQRSALFHSFLADHRLCLVNTFVDHDVENVVTRTNWSGIGSGQVYFLACSFGIACLHTSVDVCLDFNTDHHMVYATFGTELEQSTRQRWAGSARNWKPMDS